jgi:cytoskeletal protein CcmA (bactofilin family)
MMKRIVLVIFLLSLVLFAFPQPVSAQGPSGDKVVVGDSFTLTSGQTLSGNLIILGGVANLEKDSTVEGAIILTGGAINIQGKVEGNINAIGSAITLGDTAVVDGDITYVGGSITKSDSARVHGDITASNPQNFNIPLPINPGNIDKNTGINFQPIGNVLWAIFQIIAIAALALMATLLLPRQTMYLAETITTQPLTALGVGLLSLAGGLVAIVLLAITLILIPFSLLALVVFVIALVYGWIAFGLEAGKRLASLFKATWAPPVSAAIGSLVITSLAACFALIPCAGWVLIFLAAMFGLGAVVMTRFGLKELQTTPAAAVSPVAGIVPVEPDPSHTADTLEIPVIRPQDIPPSEPDAPADQPSEEHGKDLLPPVA